MGYTTDFTGQLTMSKQPTPEQVAYINQFANTRRVKRNPEITATLPDPIREAVGLPVGLDGGYYVGDEGCGNLFGGLKGEAGVIDINTPPGQKTWAERKAAGEDMYALPTFTPEQQPGLWCQWILEYEDDGYVLKWDGGEKFYSYVEWLQYLINHFFTPWGIQLNGEITWVGEDPSDLGMIQVVDSQISVKEDKVVYA